MTSVPIRTNPELRKSRLFKSMWAYMKRSATVIIRSFMMYKPLRFFCACGAVFFLIGLLISLRFVMFFFAGEGSGRIQSLLLSVALMIIGVQTIFMGLQADMIGQNRKLLEDIQYRVRKADCERKDAPDLLADDEPLPDTKGEKQEQTGAEPEEAAEKKEEVFA